MRDPRTIAQHMGSVPYAPFTLKRTELADQDVEMEIDEIEVEDTNTNTGSLQFKYG
jgi:hypothetical protein